MTQRTQHDVLVVGGGLVGASLAIALGQAGVDVGLVDAAPGTGLPPVFDERNLSFGEATVNALGALGVLRHLRAPTAPIRRIHVSRAGDFGRVVLDAAEQGRESFGQVVVARDFGDALEARLAGVQGISRYRSTRFLAIGGDVDGLRVARLAGPDGERDVHAQLLVGADGTASHVRDALAIPAERHAYGQVLMVSRVRMSRRPDGTAWERLGPTGPTALLPRGDAHHGLVHGVAEHEADAVAGLREEAWLARVQSAMGWRAGRFLASGPRAAYPIVRVVARDTVAPRAVLVGNAAQTLHPVGAQGFNLGLRDALALAARLEAGRSGDAAFDCGAPGVLRDWEAARREDRARTLAFSDGLARLTANEAGAAAWLRTLGLVGLAASPGLRAQLAGGAMGYRGETPALARGTSR